MKDIDRTLRFTNAKEYFKVNSLEKGFDSIQIRIWYGCALGTDLLVVLKNKEKDGKLRFVKLFTRRPITDGAIPFRELLFKIPRNQEWIKFINRLFDLSVLSLPDEKQLKNLRTKEDSLKQ